jgi:hypothetical protein
MRSSASQSGRDSDAREITAFCDNSTRPKVGRWASAWACGWNRRMELGGIDALFGQIHVPFVLPERNEVAVKAIPHIQHRHGGNEMFLIRL